MKRALWRLIIAMGCLGWVMHFSGPLVARWASAMAEDWYGGPSRILVVLGGGAMSKTAAATDSYLRAIHAAAVWRQHGQPAVWITGNSDTQKAITILLEQGGVPSAMIHHTRPTDSTRDDALALVEALPERDGVTVLTSDIHVPRARRTLQRVGMAVHMAPAPDCGKTAAQWPGAWPCVSRIGAEYAKTAFYWWRNWI